MNAAECNKHAAACVASAALADAEVVAFEFLELAAQWRALAVREIFLGIVEANAGPAQLKPNQSSA